jgi:hypothetical protein
MGTYRDTLSLGTSANGISFSKSNTFQSEGGDSGG